jgi:hypothetical protein
VFANIKEYVQCKPVKGAIPVDNINGRLLKAGGKGGGGTSGSGSSSGAASSSSS